MKKVALLSLALCYFLCAFAQSASREKLTVAVQTDKKIYSIKPEFWGTNFLYWIDDDAALANGKVIAGVNDVGIKMLRYPGGTVADNFHWDTGTLENTNMFPYQSGANETDFDEFMVQCRKAGAEPELVLNTETWAVKNDFVGGAHEAANWLRYCKKKGYNVKYLEIGNETYWHPIMSAEDYAHLVNVYADSLRRVDPFLILGVNGHWDINFVGTKERFKKESYDQMLQYRKNIKSKNDAASYDDFVKSNTVLPITTGNTKWWETVARICGSKVDMIVVHWYFAPSQLPIVTSKLLAVKNLFLKIYPGKKFLLNMSEYNVTERTPQSFMQLTEMIGAMLKAEMDLTALWPMRMEYKKPTLLDYKTDRPSILYQVHKYLSANLTGSLVETVSSADLPAYSSSSETGCTVVLSGSKIDRPTPVTLSVLGKQKFSSCSIWRISGNEYDYQVKQDNLEFRKGKAVVTLRPAEIMVAVFK